MNRTIWIIAFIFLTASTGVHALPQDALQELDEKPSADTKKATEDEGEDLAELTVPGEPHELLEGTVGEWDLTILVWSAPDTEPAESSGTASARWILGERFVETTYEGEVMGRPFEALKIEGFEKATEEYVTTWRDNLGTYTMIFRGRCGGTCETRTMTAEFLDPVSSAQLTIKGVTTLTEEEGYSYESFIVTPDGGEFKNMELVAERRSP